jgi:DNA-binding HxlR family transcriptional regulator
MALSRRYRDGCGIAHASELLGQRWALLIVRELLLGPKRFTDLRGGIPDVSPNVLGQRLRELEGSGIVRRRRLAPPAAAHVYELTEWGAGLEAAVLALGRWASNAPSFPRDAEMGADSLVLALKTTFNPASARGLRATYELLLDELPYRIELSDGSFSARRGEAERPEARIRSDPGTLAAVVFGGRPLADALNAGGIVLEGDKGLATRLIRLLAGG